MKLQLVLSATALAITAFVGNAVFVTMVFVVKDKALLDKTTVGAKIQFMAMNENGQMTVTDIQPVK